MDTFRRVVISLTGPILTLILKKQKLFSSREIIALRFLDLKPIKFWPYTSHFVKFDILSKFPFLRIVLPKAKDPVNIIFVTENPKMVEDIFFENGWRAAGVSMQYLFINRRWRCPIFHLEYTYASGREERFHIRIFNAGKQNGKYVLIASVHHEYYDEQKQDHFIISWEGAEKFAAGAFARFSQSLTEIITQEDWRGHSNDGRAIVVDLSKPLQKQ